MNTYNVHVETTNKVWEEIAARKDKEVIIKKEEWKKWAH